MTDWLFILRIIHIWVEFKRLLINDNVMIIIWLNHRTHLTFRWWRFLKDAVFLKFCSDNGRLLFSAGGSFFIEWGFHQFTCWLIDGLHSLRNINGLRRSSGWCDWIIDRLDSLLLTRLIISLILVSTGWVAIRTYILWTVFL